MNDLANIAALFVDPEGVYRQIDNVSLWCEQRDARTYGGPHPVVAHPPCQRWGKLARATFGRYPRPEFHPGNDGGCFERALAFVRQYGGVLEHPAGSLAWPAYELTRPAKTGWTRVSSSEWVCEVWQSAYGHQCNKATWLLYVGQPPKELNWARPRGTHQIGFPDKRGKASNKPTLSGKAASATPLLFAQELVELAMNARAMP